MSALAPQRAQVQMGQEIANSWQWLLNRAPRVARALWETPGSATTMAEIVAGFDLFHRRYDLVGVRDLQRVDRRVSYDEATDMIVVRQAVDLVKYER